MIFVTVGNATQGFGRLLNAVDRMAGEGAFGKEIVFIQSGNNPDFRFSHCKHEPFLDMENFETKIHEADLVISHAGAGTLLQVLHAGKIPIVMP
ncbi:MAG: multidrug MFS transporter, partial [Ignavibacteriales bacterium]|nr:multidrug MFS transporter [Ignavibacteriales bacterium]